MKQRVTKQQIMKLTDEQKSKLDLILHRLDPTLRDKFLWYTSVQCTIGRLTEIVDENFQYFSTEKEFNDEDGAVYWVNIDPTRSYSAYEPVDALWEAVVAILG